MKHRRILSAVLCAAMVLTSLPALPVYADSSSSNSRSAETEALKKAITEVKKRVDIPKDLDKFEYDSKTSYGTTYFELVWWKEEKDKDGYERVTDRITVEYYNGFISYYRREYDDKNKITKYHFPKLTVKQQEEYAKKYLYQLNPSLKGNPEFECNRTVGIYGGSAAFGIDRVENGIRFGRNYGEIEVDGDTGMLTEYSLNWWSDAVLPDASKRLSEREVSDIYASRKPLKAYYDLFRRELKDKNTGETYYEPYVLAVYTPTVSGENEIDALTGEYTSLYDDKKKYSYTDAYTWNGDDYDSVDCYEGAMEEAPEDDDELSDAELEALEKENSYLSYEKCLKIIKDDKYVVFNNELVQAENYITSYTDDRGDAKPARYLSFKYSTSDETKDSINLYVTMDACSGKIISFSKSYYYGRKSPKADRPAAKKADSVKLANEAAKHFIGSKADKFVYDDNVRWDKDTKRAGLRYTRYENGFPAVFDSMIVEVDSYGEVLRFNYGYHEGLSFPKPDLMDEKEAYKKLFENMKPSLYYTGFTDLQLKSHVYLTYEFDSNYYLNAITGERITYYGEAYYIKDRNPDTGKEAKIYADIKGHKYEKEITALWENGIRLTNNDKLDPDGMMTIEEFLGLMSEFYSVDYSYTYIYPSIKKYNKEKNSYYWDKNPMLGKSLTAGELAKIYLCEYQHTLYDAAGVEGVFYPPYKNIDRNDKYCGYLALAKAKGLISDRETFELNRGYRRADCLKAIYDYLCETESKPFYEIIKL